MTELDHSSILHTLNMSHNLKILQCCHVCNCHLQTISPTNYVCAVLQSISIDISHVQLQKLTCYHHETKCYRNISYGCQLGTLHSTKIVPQKHVHKFPISCTIHLPPKFRHQPLYQHELHLTELS